MTDRLAIALAQLNPTVGDIAGNIAKLRAARRQAAELGADLMLTTELVVCGYPPEDLVLNPTLQEACVAAVRGLAAETADGGPAMLVGTPWREDGKLYNAALLLADGQITATRFKSDLPNYGVFDEKRVFAAAPPQGPVNFRGVRLGVLVCEDMWSPDIVECLAESGAEILLVPNGSPYEHDKQDKRLNLAVARITESGLPLVYVNQVGGQDELVFDGASFVLDADCSLRAQFPSWREHLALTRWRREGEGWRCEPAEIKLPPADDYNGLAQIYHAMVLGLRDYVEKNRFPGVLLGLSGGIDSALSAAVAVDALGAERVWTVMMPSPYTSPDSLEDAAACASLLGVRLDSVSIAPAMQAFDEMLAPSFANSAPNITEENIQSRARGMTLMALSNKFGPMVLSTGNKSEMSVGYATLYGDMCGGFSVLKDVYKTTVFALARWRNQQRPEGARGPEGRVMPERIITKPPTAELKPNQTDQDTLPPYDRLDAILQCLVEADMAIDEIVARGHDRATVNAVWRMLDRAEYKRRQAPPGVKITRRAFGRDRRYPITNAFIRSAGPEMS
ncbi:NAD+ synthase [Rhodospirillaceae bacterium SYSU D60014]|uniref:NAD+ synthase n=1 Tax=Virgifigura deserti TaxID=2268457 RepID=UPI000E66A3DE